MFGKPAAPTVTAVADHRPSELPAGFEPSPRGRGGTAWRWAKMAATALVILSGLIQLVVKPAFRLTAGPPAPTPATPVIDESRAGAAAARFAVSYLSWAGQPYAATRAAALEPLIDGTPEVTSGTESGRWNGSAVLIADAPVVEDAQPGPTPGLGTVVVLVRVRCFTPAPGDAAPPPAPPDGYTPASGGAFTPPAPTSPWVEQPGRWLRLAVPVVLRGDTILIGRSGPVFIGAPAAAMPVPNRVAVDPRKVTAVLPKILSAYGEGDLRYVSAAQYLTGLGGGLDFATVNDIRVYPGEGPNLQLTVVAVGWTYPGTDTGISQRYALTLRVDGAQPRLLTVNPVADPATT